MEAFIKVFIAAGIIALASWLSGKRPDLAGFIMAFPIASIIALGFSYIEYRDSAQSIAFAKSILVGIPISCLFFIPFFFADKFQLNFVSCFISGLVLLAVGFFLHQGILSFLK
jgi:uncharacterized membrane protein (GlpM family)